MAALAKDPAPADDQPRGRGSTTARARPSRSITSLAAFKSGRLPAGARWSTARAATGWAARVWRCHKDSGHGPVDAQQALQYSCDVWFYRVADTDRAGPHRGDGQALGLGSAHGHRRAWPRCRASCRTSAYHDKATPGGYTKGMALNSAIGQGDVNVTPLQLAMVYAAHRQRRQRCTSRSWCSGSRAPDGKVRRGVRAEGGAHGRHRPRAPQGRSSTRWWRW